MVELFLILLSIIKFRLSIIVIIFTSVVNNKVDNPSDGAYYIESLTEQLAEKALQLFKDIESNVKIITFIISNIAAIIEIYSMLNICDEVIPGLISINKRLLKK